MIQLWSIFTRIKYNSHCILIMTLKSSGSAWSCSLNLLFLCVLCEHGIWLPKPIRHIIGSHVSQQQRQLGGVYFRTGNGCMGCFDLCPEFSGSNSIWKFCSGEEKVILKKKQTLYNAFIYITFIYCLISCASLKVIAKPPENWEGILHIKPILNLWKSWIV